MTTATIQSPQPSVWWVFLLQGIAAFLLGVMLLTAPGATLLTLVTFLGFYWIVSGVLSFVQMFVDRSVPWIWSLLIGITGVAAGILIVRHPMVAALTVPTLIVIVFGVEGLVMGYWSSSAASPAAALVHSSGEPSTCSSASCC